MRLVAVQLHGVERHQRRHAVDVVRRLIDEHADRSDVRRQRRGDRPRARAGSMIARAARPEDEPDRRRAELRPQRAASSSAADAADLDTALPASCASQLPQRGAGIGLVDAALTDEKRV